MSKNPLPTWNLRDTHFKELEHGDPDEEKYVHEVFGSTFLVLWYFQRDSFPTEATAVANAMGITPFVIMKRSMHALLCKYVNDFSWFLVVSEGFLC